MIKQFRQIFMTTLLVLLSWSAYSLPPTEKMDYWSQQRVGANGELLQFRPEWFEAAAAAGIEYIRFHPGLLPADDRDFLIGDADDFQTLNDKDLALLIKILDEAEKQSLKVVVVMFSLPGCRYNQQNGYKDDYRLWEDDGYQEQAFSFWKQLAARLKDHPAVVAYNPLNEPHPEMKYAFEEVNPEFLEWIRLNKGTSQDLNRFNRGMVRAIREADKNTPIMLDGYFYADPQGFSVIEPVDDEKVLYAFHNIGPWQFTAFRANKGRYSYPDRLPEVWNGPGVPWTIRNLRDRITPVLEFSETCHIPRNRIIASELWCDRRVGGCKEYFSDAITLYNENDWHWAFYNFRSDGDWTGLDYEMGSEPMGADYWAAVEDGEDYEALKERGDNPIWDVLKREFRGGRR